MGIKSKKGCSEKGDAEEGAILSTESGRSGKKKRKGPFQRTRKANELEDKADRSQELPYPQRCQQ